MTAWPTVVWDASLLRGLDARARAEIEAAGRVRRLAKDELLFRHGDPADALFVVASGSCALSGVRRGDDDAAVIRRARRGDVLGEEATVAAFSTRQLEARCEEEAVVAEVPLVVLRRAVGRGGGAGLERVERQLRRAATLDLLRTTSFTRALADADIEVLLDAAQHRHVPRGEHVYGEGDPPDAAYLVADGLLQAQTGDEGRPRVEAYLGRGDLFGEEELAEREPRRVAVVASGPTWLVAIPRDVFLVVARRNEGALAAARRLKGGERPPKALSNTTTHVFQDLYRMRVARSLLVIDQDSCIRCGHCAWSCADAHADGVSRLVRRGDKLVAPGAVPLLVPNSCQHCKNPACMIDCPTGAIGRDARGEVFIREDLCTGCGSCAKACPWENIAMAPAPAPKAGTPKYPLVAVKCDLCKGEKAGPACVNACPTEAIARIDPNVALVPLAPGAAAAPVLPARTPAWPWLAGAALAAMGLGVLGVGRWPSGIAAGVLVLALVAYSAVKRLRLRLSSRYMYIAHMSFGVLALGVSVAHVGARIPPNVAGALTLSLALAVLSGLAGGALNVVVPRMLARLERKTVLPEELASRARDLDGQVFRALSGKSELVKTLFVKSLRPYLRARLGPLWLVASRRSLREEERSLRTRLDALMGAAAPAKGAAAPAKGTAAATKTAGLDDLVRLVVEHRATRAQRALTWILRGWLVPHLAATAAALVLLVLHVIGVAR
ncbi:MAG: cyclic nucleotide-binding domain-containing protein [Labilithrix sp.]|nr:cyclic nucleotide-binding domain-containing protein [Labilithrix sp.]MCW5816561.1 cyclic nucleotide-binding domain-containing protein [Labilithrix sp.]